MTRGGVVVSVGVLRMSPGGGGMTSVASGFGTTGRAPGAAAAVGGAAGTWAEAAPAAAAKSNARVVRRRPENRRRSGWGTGFFMPAGVDARERADIREPPK